VQVKHYGRSVKFFKEKPGTQYLGAVKKNKAKTYL
jgi:hypothetical protein